MAIHLRHDGSVARLRIDRPERRNALNSEALDQIDEALGAIADSAARVCIVEGTDGHFCAGADLTELEDLSFTHHLRGVLDRLAGLPIVSVASIEGACMGLGVQLAAACDVRVADEGAYFGVPVAKLGLMVDQWTVRRVAALFGVGAARHMMLTAAVLSGDDAFRLGAVQSLGGVAAAEEIAERVVSLAPLSIAGTKLGLDRWTDEEFDPDYVAAFERAWASEDLAEGFVAFAERRSAVFQGR